MNRLGFEKATIGQTPLYAHWYIIANFVIAFGLLSTRGPKVALGLDHNFAPREDLDKYGTAAVQKGKITQKQLNRLKRRQAAHENAVEHLPFFIGGLLFAIVAKLPGETINVLAALYTLVRVSYAIAYVQIEDAYLSYLRSLIWWAGNFVCFRLYYLAGKKLNGF